MSKGASLRAIGLIHGRNLGHDHGYFLAQDKEVLFFKFKTTLKNTTPSRLFFTTPHLHSDLQRVLIRKPYNYKNRESLECLQILEYNS